MAPPAKAGDLDPARCGRARGRRAAPPGRSPAGTSVEGRHAVAKPEAPERVRRQGRGPAKGVVMHGAVEEGPPGQDSQGLGRRDGIDEREVEQSTCWLEGFGDAADRRKKRADYKGRPSIRRGLAVSCTGGMRDGVAKARSAHGSDPPGSLRRANPVIGLSTSLSRPPPIPRPVRFPQPCRPDEHP